MSTRGTISLILGIIVGLLGLMPILKIIGILPFEITSTLPGFILYILVVAGGIFLLIDSVHEVALRWISVILGLIVVTLGLVGLLSYMGVIAFSLGFIPGVLWYIIYIATGLFLIFGSGD